MNILIVTLGTRDINIDNELIENSLSKEELEECKNKHNGYYARLLGEKIQSHFDRFKKDIRLPIIMPCLDYLKAKNIQINKLWIVATDQDNEQGHFALSDTIEYANIIKKLIPSIFHYQKQFPKGLIFSFKEQVSFLDHVYKQLEKSNLINSVDREINEAQNVFLLNQGGIDAINTALLFQLLKICDKKLIHLSVNERSNFCFKLDFSEKFLQEKEDQRVLNLIKNFNYGTIEDFNIPEPIKKIAKYANARLHFDFDNCKRILYNADNTIREFAIDHLQQLTRITSMGDNSFEMIKELYFNTRIKFEQQSYVDFLLRFFRIVEYFAQQAVIELLQINNYNHKEWKDEVDYFIKNNQQKGLDIKDYLDEQKINGEKLIYAQPVIPVFISIMKFFNHPDKEFIEQISTLTTMRNKSIGAHDFQPVSLYRIQEKLNEKDLDIQTVFAKFDTFFNIDFNNDNPFLKINKTIGKILK